MAAINYTVLILEIDGMTTVRETLFLLEESAVNRIEDFKGHKKEKEKTDILQFKIKMGG